eukprot:495351_1
MPTEQMIKQREKLFIIEVVPIETTMKAENRVKLMADIINYEAMQMENMYYRWIEVNGLLTETEIQKCRENVFENSMNLVLRPNALNDGEIYSFKLIIEQYKYPINDEEIKRRLSDNIRIGYGESTATDIFIFTAPIVRQNSFDIEPKCVNEYESISDFLSIKHRLTISADDDYIPLAYQFGYIDMGQYHYFHTNTLLPE